MDPDPQQTFYYKEQIVWMLFFYNTYGWLKVVHSRWERTCSFHRNFTKMLPKEYFIYTKSEDTYDERKSVFYGNAYVTTLLITTTITC